MFPPQKLEEEKKIKLKRKEIIKMAAGVNVNFKISKENQ